MTAKAGHREVLTVTSRLRLTIARGAIKTSPGHCPDDLVIESTKGGATVRRKYCQGLDLPVSVIEHRCLRPTLKGRRWCRVVPTPSGANSWLRGTADTRRPGGTGRRLAR